MKLMIASDIHGSAYYCDKLFEAMAVEQPDKLLLLGDLLYHGPRNDLPKDYAPKKVIEMLNENKEKILTVQGNCEAYVDQMVLDFPVLAEYGVWMLEHEGRVRMMFFTHGHLHNEEKLPMLQKGDILLHGHTHVPVMADRGDYIYLNPGSVSIPKEGSAHGYMVYENGLFVRKDLEKKTGNGYEVIESFEL